MDEQEKHVDVTIRMPAKWVNRFWGWWLDGGGDDGFYESLELTDEQEEAYCSDWDREQLLLVHSDGQTPMQGLMKK